LKFNKDDEEKLEVEELQEKSVIVLKSGDDDAMSRTIGLFGDLDDEKSGDIIYSMLMLRENAEQLVPVEDGAENEFEKINRPIEFIMATPGGSADNMFGIYDIMRLIQQENVDIVTTGVGYVMSAGVLLLAAGTKGQRRIGKHCRVMIHAVIGGNHGSLHNLENELEEVKNVQEQYTKALVQETSMTTRQLKKLLDRKINIYLTAEEAVEYGIADIII